MKFLFFIFLLSLTSVVAQSFDQKIIEAEKNLFELKKKQNQVKKVSAKIQWNSQVGQTPYKLAVFKAVNQPIFEKYVASFIRLEQEKKKITNQILRLEKEKEKIQKGEVSSRNIRLKWSKDPIAVSYQVRLFDKSKTKLKEENVKNNFVRFDVPPGDYFFAVAGISKFNVRGEFSDLIAVKVEIENDQMQKDLDTRIAKLVAERESKKSLQEDIDQQIKALAVSFGVSEKNNRQVDLLPGDYGYIFRPRKSPWSDVKALKVNGGQKDLTGEITTLEKKLIDLKVQRALQKQKPKPSGGNVAGIGLDYVLADKELEKFNNFVGVSVFIRNQTLFNKFINPELLFSYHKATGAESPFNSLTVVRAYAVFFYDYRLDFISNKLALLPSLGAGITIFSLFSDSFSNSYVTSGLMAGIEVNYEIIKYLQLYVRFNTNYVFDRTANLLFLNPMIGVGYRF